MESNNSDPVIRRSTRERHPPRPPPEPPVPVKRPRKKRTPRPPPPPVPTGSINYLDVLSGTTTDPYFISNQPNLHFLVGDQKFPAHKVILASRSTYFQEMLYGDVVNTNLVKAKSFVSQMRVNHVSAAAVMELLKFIYEDTGKMTFEGMTHDLLSEVLRFSKEWLMFQLEKDICKHLNQPISLELEHPTTILVPDESVNVSLISNGATVLTGEMPRDALIHEFDFKTKTLRGGYTQHAITTLGNGNREGIVVKLKHLFMINYVQILLQDKDIRSYTYFVEVSADRNEWVRIWDRTAFPCRAWQEIHFQEMPVQYIKVVGIGAYNTTCQMFQVFTMRAQWSSRTPPEIDLNYGVVVPTENTAYLTNGAKVIQGHQQGRRYGMLSPCSFFLPVDPTRYTFHEIYDEPEGIVIALNQPYSVNSMRFKLDDWWGRYLLMYLVEVSTNQVDWEEICRQRKPKKNPGPWHIITFPQRPVTFIRLTGLGIYPQHKVEHKQFRCMQFECPPNS